MANADKCHLNIPFKETAKANLLLDDQGQLESGALERFQEQEFENYKSIERRVNDAACQGGEGCTVSAWVGESSTFATGSDTFAVSGNSQGSVAFTDWTELWNNGDWDVSEGIYPLQPGLYECGMIVFVADAGGASDFMVNPYITATYNNGSSFDWFGGGCYSPSGWPARGSTVAAGEVRSGSTGLGNDGFIPSFNMVRPTAGTRSFQLGVCKFYAIWVCGSDL